MMEMIIKDAKTKEILLEKKYQANTPISSNSGKCRTLHIQNDEIDNKVVEYYNEDSIIVFGTMDIKKDIYVDMYADQPVYEMHFCMNGHSAFNSPTTMIDFSKNEHNLYAYKELQGHFKQHENTNAYLEVIFKNDYIEQLLDNYQTLRPAIGRGKDQLFRQNASVTREMSSLITELYNTNRTGVMKQMYLDIKSKELLLLQIEQYILTNTMSTSTKISITDKSKLVEAKEIIEQNFQNPLSLIQLAKRVGLNDYKLKKGFKEEYNTTVFGYVYQLRMEYAHKMLLNTEIPIKEIANYCGYEHVQHFTTAFKRMYNITPALYRKQ